MTASAHREQAGGTHDDVVGYVDGMDVWMENEGTRMMQDSRGDKAFITARTGKSR